MAFRVVHCLQELFVLLEGKATLRMVVLKITCGKEMHAQIGNSCRAY